MSKCRANAPTDSITFSHAHDSWLASWFGEWVFVSVKEVRKLVDKGWRVMT